MYTGTTLQRLKDLILIAVLCLESHETNSSCQITDFLLLTWQYFTQCADLNSISSSPKTSNTAFPSFPNSYFVYNQPCPFLSSGFRVSDFFLPWRRKSHLVETSNLWETSTGWDFCYAPFLLLTVHIRGIFLISSPLSIIESVRRIRAKKS